MIVKIRASRNLLAWGRMLAAGFVVVLAMLPPAASFLLARVSELGAWADVAVHGAELRRQLEASIATHHAKEVRWRKGCAIPDPDFLELHLQRAADRHDVDVAIIRSMVEHESGGRPCATSNRGAAGLLQLMPDTARAMGVRNVYDPVQNIEGGTRFLKMLLSRYDNNLALALAAYNAGPGTVDLHGGIPPIKETQAYVRGILRESGMISQKAR